MNIKNIVLGKNSKRNKLNMSADVNATFDFGIVQPTYYAPMMKNDTLSLSVRQLVRLAPMPTPSFARMSLHNKGVFVPYSDVFPAYDALLAHVNVTTNSASYIPESVTCVSPKLILLFILQFYSIFSARSIDIVSEGHDTLSDTLLNHSQLINAFDKFARSYGMLTHSQVVSWLDSTDLYAQYNDLSVEQSDYVFRDVDNGFYYLFKLTNEGKRLVNIFAGLGYSLDIMNNDLVSFLPVLAFYKAWFDIYSPKRFMTWSNTYAFKLINYVYENNAFSINDMLKDGGYKTSTLKSFLAELSECFVTTNDDYVSIHSRKPLNDASLGSIDAVNLGVPSLKATDPKLEATIMQEGNGLPPYVSDTQIVSGITSVPSGISQYSLNILKSFSHYLNKNSVLGKRVDSILATLFGSTPSSEFFDPTKPLFDMVTPCSIDDVFNTTQNYSQGGEDLGSYAGRGIGKSADKFSFSANANGIFIILSSLVPQSGYFQGTAPYLYGLTRYTLPNPSFDALGLEVTPLACIEDNRGFYDNATLTRTIDLTGQGFGYIPRYSGFKCHRNIVLGDMAHRSTRSSYEPYFLDRILTPTTLMPSKAPDGSAKTAYQVQRFSLPTVASEEFRYINRYDYMGDYNRLFYNRGVFGIEYEDKPIYVRDDNFIVQSVIDATQTTILKPLEMSFDTFDKDVDDSTIEVQAQ